MLVNIRNVMDTKEESFCITDREGWYIPGYWSPDNSKLNCSQLVTLTYCDVWLLDVKNRRMSHIDLGNNKKGRFIVGPWSTDEKGFYLISDLKKEFSGLAFYDLDRSELEWILTPQHDIELLDLSSDGKTLAWSENIEGYSGLFIKNLQNNDIMEIVDISLKGVIQSLRLSPDGKKIGIMMETPLSPANIYVIEIGKTGETKSQRITNSLLGNIPENLFVKPELIKYKSFDNLEISALLYKPQNINKTNTIEKREKSITTGGMDNENHKKIVNGVQKGAILSIHGGPAAQERPYYGYSGLYQYLAYNGFTIIAPNFRGSTGYGKTFEKKIYHDWGGNELRDYEYALKWLLLQDWIDSNRIGVFGVSFGGFATLSCITRLLHYDWKVAVDIFGPSNLITFVKAVSEHWKRFMAELVGDPETELAFLNERSPINYIDNINPSTNLLVIQGARDPE
jgi:dipeptidyl aminopeptidase/acylaminoacyl peptidase